jgi:hypothetical protein
LADRSELLGIDPRQRRGQVIAQREPVAGILLPGEHPGMGPVDIGQILAQRLERFHRRAVQRLEPPLAVDGRDGRQHLVPGRDLGPEHIAKALWRFGPGPPDLALVACHGSGSAPACRAAARA